MAWREFSACGQAELAFLRGKQASKDYIKTIFNILTPFAKIHHEYDFDFHQDTPQRRRWHFFRKNEYHGMVSMFCGLNPIDKVLGARIRQVYYNGKQYLTIKESKEAIIEAWKILRKEYLEQLVASTKSRCIYIIEKKGQRTS